MFYVTSLIADFTEFDQIFMHMIRRTFTIREQLHT